MGTEHQSGGAQCQERQDAGIIIAQRRMRGLIERVDTEADPEQVTDACGIRQRQDQTEGPGNQCVDPVVERGLVPDLALEHGRQPRAAL